MPPQQRNCFAEVGISFTRILLFFTDFHVEVRRWFGELTEREATSEHYRPSFGFGNGGTRAAPPQQRNFFADIGISFQLGTSILDGFPLAGSTAVWGTDRESGPHPQLYDLTFGVGHGGAGPGLLPQSNCFAEIGISFQLDTSILDGLPLAGSTAVSGTDGERSHPTPSTKF